MTNTNLPKFFRAFSIALLGLILIGAGLMSDAEAAMGCSAQVQKAKSGVYGGCLVKMGNREFTIAADQSSADGCSQVCSIMAEVANAKAGENSARLGKSTFQE